MSARALTGLQSSTMMGLLAVQSRTGSVTTSKSEYDSGGKTEVVLAAVDRIGKVSEKVVGLDGTNCDVFPQRDVHAAAGSHSECGCGSGTTRSTGKVSIAHMSGSQQEIAKWDYAM